MKRFLHFLVAICLALLPLSSTSGAPPAPPQPPERHYAPDRDVRATHLQLDITPDFLKRTIQGRAIFRFVPVAKPVQELKLDAVDLNVSSVTSTATIQAWQVADDKLTVTFTQSLPPEKEVTLTIDYSAEPTRGLYFRTPEMGYKPGEAHLFTQGEETDERCWYPCLDSPNQILTTEVTCRVPAGMTVLSNGRLVSQEKDPATGLVAFHWSQEQPHANYLVSLVAGYFKKLADKYGKLPIAFYTLPSEAAQAASSFRDTADMLKFFEQDTGIAYPWAKYDQVCVNDFVAGGMENTSLTTLTDGTLFTDATENIHDSEGLVAHEMAHQWFGDLVTCKDWSHTWLNEGFATYYETLYNRHKHGRDAFLYELFQRNQSLTRNKGDVTPIVRRDYFSPGDMFGHLTYAKASMVLHMIRSQLGEDLYHQCVKTYLERFRHRNVDTEDFRKVIEELSGRTYDRFFDQWLYHGHYPELDVTYAWDEPSKSAKVTVRQVQDLSENVLLFQFPLTVRFKGPSGSEDRTLQVTRKEEDFSFTLPAAPSLVLIDPEVALLAKIQFSFSGPMLRAALGDKEDVTARLAALQQLDGRKDGDTIGRLKELLQSDPFYGIRIGASQALRTIHNDDSLAALLDSLQQPDARVRNQVVQDIGGFYDEKAYAAAREVLQREKNPAILAGAIRSLGVYARPEVKPTLFEYLNSTSYHNELAVAALDAMRQQDDASYIPLLMETLPRREAEFTTRGFGQGLEALGYLARNQDNKDDVREFLLRYVNSKKRGVQFGSINALGTLGDTKAIPVLEKYAVPAKYSPERAAVDRALLSLRNARKPTDQLPELRQEVLDLKKSNQDLKQQLEVLKKELASKAETKTAAPAKPTPKPPTKSPKAKN